MADSPGHGFSGAVLKPYSMDALYEELKRVAGYGIRGNLI
jgi:hypothetical protein